MHHVHHVHHVHHRLLTSHIGMWPVVSRPSCPSSDRSGLCRGRNRTWQSADVDLNSGAGLLHRLTSYRPDREWDVPVDDPRVRHDLIPNDLQTLPPPMKTYSSQLPTLALPRDLPTLVSPPRRSSPVKRYLLYPSTQPNSAACFSSAPASCELRSAMGAASCSELRVPRSALPLGGLRQHPRRHRGPRRRPLVRPRRTHARSSGTCCHRRGHDSRRNRGAVADGVALRRRGWRHLYWDAGTLLSQLSAAAASAGMAPRLRSLFPECHGARAHRRRWGARVSDRVTVTGRR